MKMETDVYTGKYLVNRDFIKLSDYNANELFDLLQLAAEMKKDCHSGMRAQPLDGCVIGMLFMKPSTRTRLSFEVGISHLGGTGIYLDPDHMQLGRGESIADTAKVLSQYVDGLMIRTYSQDVVEEFAAYSDIPLINGLTDKYHPCQVMADLLTIQEVKGSLNNVQLAYLGDGHNIAHSLMIGAALTGMNITVATPEKFQPDPDVIDNALNIAKRSGSKIDITNDPHKAVYQADVVYTDVWASMGQESEQLRRQDIFYDYQVNALLLNKAKHDAIFMHCMPAHKGQEVTADVIDGEQSAVLQQAENRLHVQKALMAAIMGRH